MAPHNYYSGPNSKGDLNFCEFTVAPSPDMNNFITSNGNNRDKRTSLPPDGAWLQEVAARSLGNMSGYDAKACPIARGKFNSEKLGVSGKFMA